jgi:hypothetical protein
MKTLAICLILISGSAVAEEPMEIRIRVLSCKNGNPVKNRSVEARFLGSNSTVKARTDKNGVALVRGQGTLERAVVAQSDRRYTHDIRIPPPVETGAIYNYCRGRNPQNVKTDATW